MTKEDRFLRKQWLDDQLLTAREPVHVPELYPRNIIRRTLAVPWDIFFNAIRPIIVSIFQVLDDTLFLILLNNYKSYIMYIAYCIDCNIL